ncbi:MAG: bacillithiol biosynthesis deacetylase BshB1 [Bacteroidetes bacterium]|nr:bacillithiol biosynthesis deacetylase BshB1 [Bacteroidota bacterium]
MKLDLLGIVAHPDDAELAFGGTLIKLSDMGKRCGVVDLTRGELGSRGTPALRAQEADAASRVLGLLKRENLGLADGFFEETPESLQAVVRALRTYQPDVVLTNAAEDRHPDHGRACKLVQRACFLSGLVKIETVDTLGNPQQPWRPRQVFYSIQDKWLTPHFVVDISAQFERKLQAIRCYSSQFWDPDAGQDNGPQTPISTAEFWEAQKSRAKETGHFLRTQFAEGFLSSNPLPAQSPLDFLG